MSKKGSIGTTSMSRQSSFAFKGGSESLNDAALQFKLSKKVAELTLVVHMLFTRNHEREVELESTKTAYEMEIDTITNTFKEEIHRIRDENGDYKMKHLQEIEQIKHENSEAKKKLVEAHNKKVTEQSIELEKCKAELETSGSRMKRLQDEFDKLQKDFDLLSNERNLKNKVLEKDHVKIEKLQHQARINKEVMEKMKESIHSIQKSVNNKVQALERNNKVCNDLADTLRLQNELLENDYRTLKKKLADQTQHIKRLECQPAVPSCATSGTARAKTVESQSDRRSRDEEIERLKQEIQKYKLELSNRENNFNKIFSDIRPVMLNNGVCVRDSRELESRDSREENAVSRRTKLFSFK